MKKAKFLTLHFTNIQIISDSGYNYYCAEATIEVYIKQIPSITKENCEGGTESLLENNSNSDFNTVVGFYYYEMGKSPAPISLCPKTIILEYKQPHISNNSQLLTFNPYQNVTVQIRNIPTTLYIPDLSILGNKITFDYIDKENLSVGVSSRSGSNKEIKPNTYPEIVIVNSESCIHLDIIDKPNYDTTFTYIIRKSDGEIIYDSEQPNKGLQ